jgi:TonB family protein
MRRLAIACLATIGFPLLVDAQSVPPKAALPQAIYSPRPVYRPEWAKQGLSGNGVVLVTIDPKTGNVSGVRMLQSTGSSVLDGAALQAYSQWRFKPGSVTQVKMPISFAGRQAGPASAQPAKPLPASYYFLILVGVVVFAMAFFGRRRR